MQKVDFTRTERQFQAIIGPCGRNDTHHTTMWMPLVLLLIFLRGFASLPTFSFVKQTGVLIQLYFLALRFPREWRHSSHWVLSSTSGPHAHDTDDALHQLRYPNREALHKYIRGRHMFHNVLRILQLLTRNASQHCGIITTDATGSNSRHTPPHFTAPSCAIVHKASPSQERSRSSSGS